MPGISLSLGLWVRPQPGLLQRITKCACLPHCSGCLEDAKAPGDRPGASHCLTDQIFWDTFTFSFTLTPLGPIPSLIFIYFSKCLKYLFFFFFGLSSI